MKCNERLKKLMINPSQSKKLKYFHVLLAVTLYFDIIMTSILMGHWEFLQNDYSQSMNHQTVFTVIIIIQGIGILLNFVKAQVIDVQLEDNPTKVALNYINGTFIYDAISIVPYNIVKKDFLILRLLKIRKFQMYQGFIESFLIENSSALLMSNESMIKLVEFLNMATQLVLISHFFACLWILIGEYRRHRYEDGWISS